MVRGSQSRPHRGHFGYLRFGLMAMQPCSQPGNPWQVSSYSTSSIRIMSSLTFLIISDQPHRMSNDDDSDSKNNSEPNIEHIDLRLDLLAHSVLPKTQHLSITRNEIPPMLCICDLCIARVALTDSAALPHFGHFGFSAISVLQVKNILQGTLCLFECGP